MKAIQVRQTGGAEALEYVQRAESYGGQTRNIA